MLTLQQSFAPWAMKPNVAATPSSPFHAAAMALPVDLRRIIRPEAANRWLLPGTNLITPAYIETILRNALTGSHVQQWELFDLMEDTWPRLAKNLNELKRAVIARHWKCEAWAEEDQPPTTTALERKQLVSRAVWTMRPAPDQDANGFEKTIYDILDAWGKGVSVLEIEWEQRHGGKILGDINAPKSSWWVHPSNYAWSDEGWLGLTQPGSGSSGAFRDQIAVDRFPDDKFLIAICKARSGHPLAGALLRPLAFWWCAANFTANWFLNFAQIFGLPIRWANYDPNVPGLVDKVADMLENMGTSAWGAFPVGTTLELKEPMKSGTDNPQAALLDRADTQCDILILGQTLTTSTPQSGGGTRAQGEVHLSVREDVIDAAADFAASVINLQLVPMLLRLNYGDDTECPEFCPEAEREEDEKANAETLEIAVRTGVKVPAKWAHQKLGIPLPQAGEEIIEQAAPSVVAATPSSPEKNVAVPFQAKSATDKILDTALENLTGVEARWLAGVKPFFQDLIYLAQNSETISDTQFIATLEKASRQMPELFAKLKPEELEVALNHAMSAALVNGASRGFMQRKSKP